MPEWATPDQAKTQNTACTGTDHLERGSGMSPLEGQNPTGKHLEQHNLIFIRSSPRRSLHQSIFLLLHSTVLNPYCRVTHKNLNFSTMFKLTKICSHSTYFVQFWTSKQIWTGKYSHNYHSQTRHSN